MMRTLVFRLRQYSRRKRYETIQRLLRVEQVPGFILDLGGGLASFFAAMFPRPEQVILLDIDYNRARQAKRKYPPLHVMIADGGRIPLADCSVDMAVCNSVIEHVNDPDTLAAEIRRVSQSYFLQTPNGDFPLETHSFVAIPFYNFITWRRLRWFACKIFGASFEYVDGVRYLPEQRLRYLFPEATVVYETVFGLKKSFYVYYLNRAPAQLP
jgi:ubiquinone/menaquinone biosynthesis C-methylase UbiE